MPEGRFAFNISPHVFEVMPHVDNATITIWLLQNDARLCAQDGDFEGAWASCQAALHDGARERVVAVVGQIHGDGLAVARRLEAVQLGHQRLTREAVVGR